MYQYNPVDQAIVDARVEEFRDQVKRFRAGELSDNEFLALRLRNGLYMQRHAFMLRVAIPYGLLSSKQVRMLAHIARKYDKGYGHFTTRQNIQYNWPELDDVPDILADLASVEMHAIQTSGNCVRNVTADQYAGVAPDEVLDPRPLAEMLRQWSTLHPEFNYLPRKFKLALTGAKEDRAAIRFHDIGLVVVQNDAQELGVEVWVGGGIGRTPVIAKKIEDFVPVADMLTYVESILRVYNLEGNRKNKYQARIKILVRKLGAEVFRDKVRAFFEPAKGGQYTVRPEEVERFTAFFAPPAYKTGLPVEVPVGDAGYTDWLARNTKDHKVSGYRVVVIPLKNSEQAPGDATDEQMEAIADIADEFSFGEIRTTHEQNLILADVEVQRLPEVFEQLKAVGFAQANHGLLTDMICCPGLDFCSLANASSLNIAKDINERFAGTEKLVKIGQVKLKMSGCVNACGHHHVGHVGILGIDKKGEQAYQIMLGGEAGHDASLGKWVGPAMPREELPDALDDLFDVYLEERRDENETLLEVARRLGVKPFFERIYEKNDGATGGAA